tara:strand:- start:186 stop:584 length:399 start_codon:yes stop_codon:yes gene_type:complete
MNYLPIVLVEYILYMSNNLARFVIVNRSYKNLFKEKVKKSKCKYNMNRVISTILVDMKYKDFKKVNNRHYRWFDTYVFLNLDNKQQIDSFRKWWVEMYQDQGDDKFIEILKYMSKRNFKSVRKVILEYLKLN